MLESVNNDQDRALDILLGMSDPEYVSTQAPQVRSSFCSSCVRAPHPLTPTLAPPLLRDLGWRN